jgi:L-arabinonolactonase
MPPFTRVATLAVDARCTLGEGAAWCTRRQAVIWTDIDGSRLWQFSPASGDVRSWALPDRAGAFVLCTSGRVLLGLAKGLAFADIDGHSGSGPLRVVPVLPVEPDEPRTRINDGRTDRQGRFVFGTMNEQHATGERLGHFYQFTLAHGVRRLPLDPVAISNSLCFSPDGATIYFADSPTARIMCGDYDGEAARVTRVREFVRLDAGDGMPDGSVVDAGGGLWNAAWGSGTVRRYTSAGALDRTVTMAAINVTCPVFGGSALADLYVTSSRQEMDEAALAARPHAGGLFRADDLGVTGLADCLFPDPA